jgi:hypothetical protein
LAIGKLRSNFLKFSFREFGESGFEWICQSVQRKSFPVTKSPDIASKKLCSYAFSRHNLSCSSSPSTLDLNGYNSVDLTGLTSLTRFRWHTHYNPEIHGKEQIYPQLTSFESTHAPLEDLALLRNVRTFNALSLGIDIRQFSPQVSSLIYEKLQNQKEFHINKELKE